MRNEQLPGIQASPGVPPVDIVQPVLPTMVISMEVVDPIQTALVPQSPHSLTIYEGGKPVQPILGKQAIDPTRPFLRI